jgi:hypothetical protein
MCIFFVFQSKFCNYYIWAGLTVINIYIFRMFLCLFAGGQPQQLPKGLGTEGADNTQSHVTYSDKRYVM